MSAPNQGRQSPEPERQSGSQINKPADPNNQAGAASGETGKKESQSTLADLPSNPKGPLDDAADAKTSKGHHGV